MSSANEDKPKWYNGLLFNLKDGDDRVPKYKEQLKSRGFDDTETWSLDTTIAKFIYPRLQRYYELADDVVDIDYHEGFREAIEIMLEGFEIIVSDDYYIMNEEQSKKVEDALAKFAEYFEFLWW